MSVDEHSTRSSQEAGDGEFEDLVALRRDLHRHPETRFTERRTAAVLADRLRDAGFDVHTDFAATAVLGTIDSGRPGAHVLLRADMDALPTNDLKDTGYASTNVGVCHACGHDVHCAVVLGAARLLLADGSLREGGRLSVLYQPAEEIPFGESSGAQAVLDSGLLDDADITAVLGLHCWPKLPAGVIGVDPRVAMAAKLAFKITVSGNGAHAATPQLGRDALLAASELVVALHTLIGRETDPSDRVALNVGTAKAGDSQSVVPPSAELTGTLRTVDADVAERMRVAVDRVAAGIGVTFDVRVDVDWKNAMPPVRNDPRLVQLASDVVARAPHVHRVVTLPDPPMTTDDFALYAQRWPGAYLKLGVAEPGADSWPSLHDGRFDVDETCIPTGAHALAAMAAAILESGPADVPEDDAVASGSAD